MYPIIHPSKPSVLPDTTPATAPISLYTRRQAFREQRSHRAPSIKITNYTSRNLFFEERNSCGSETVVFLHELYGCHLEFKYVELAGSGADAFEGVGGGGYGGGYGGGFRINDDKDAWGLATGNGYHILIPDLPGHSSSRELLWSHPADIEGDQSEAKDAHITNPSLLQITCEHLNHLIHQHAKRRRAHLVGIGYGAYIALQMAKLFPASVLCVIAITTSCLSIAPTHPINPSSFKRNLTFFSPYLSYASLKPILTIPRLYQWMIEDGRTARGGPVANKGEKSNGLIRREKVYKGVKLPEGLTEEMWENTRLELAKKAYHAFRTEFNLSDIIRTIINANNSEHGGDSVGWADRGYWRTNANGNGGIMNLDWYGSKKRTLLVIGNEEEWVELVKSKDLEVLLANDVKDVSSKKNDDRFMIATRGMVHAWNLHEPEVFARMIEGWIQEGEDGLSPELVGSKAWADEEKVA